MVDYAISVSLKSHILTRIAHAVKIIVGYTIQPMVGFCISARHSQTLAYIVVDYAISVPLKILYFCTQITRSVKIVVGYVNQPEVTFHIPV